MADSVIPKKITAQDYLGFLGREITRIGGGLNAFFYRHRILLNGRAGSSDRTLKMPASAMSPFALQIRLLICSARKRIFCS